jgi:hypothetical protein
MTLILNILTSNRIIQASDRRLTLPNGDIFDDEANKAICVVCADAIFSIGYTGLAYFGKKRTDEWLTEYLAEMNLEELQLSCLVENLRNALKIKISTLPNPISNKGLSVVIAGFLNNYPIVCQISNLEDECFSRLKKTDSEFHVGILQIKKGFPEKRLFCCSFHGWESSVNRTLTNHIKRLKRTRFFHKSGNSIVANEAVSLIRAAARNTESKNKIGRSCMSVVIEKNSLNFETRYHPARSSPQLYAPHLVTPGASFKNFELWTGEGPPKWWKEE